MIVTKRSVFIIIISCVFCLISVNAVSVGPDLVKREQRKSLVATDLGEISAVNISSDGINGPFHVQFFTMEPGALLLPVLLHSDMVLYVHSGRGKLSYTEENNLKMVPVQKGDLFRLEPGSVFYVHSSAFPQAEKLTFFALFTNTDPNTLGASIDAYSRLSDVFTDFDAKILQSAFKLSTQAAEEIANATAPPAIVSAPAPGATSIGTRLLKTFLLDEKPLANLENKKSATLNVFSVKPDFQSCYGWTLNMNVKDKKKSKSHKGSSSIAISMVNMTRGSMMAPHWNPEGPEVAVVLQGEGMVKVSCSRVSKDSGCESVRFKVREGDVFAVPKFHSVAQMSFNYDQFVLMGFSRTSVKDFRPQFVTGKSSVFRAVERSVLARALNVGELTVGQLLAPQPEAVLLDCTSCAEAEELKMEESQKGEPETEPEKGEPGTGKQGTEPERGEQTTKPGKEGEKGPEPKIKEPKTEPEITPGKGGDPWTEAEREREPGTEPGKGEQETEPGRESEQTTETEIKPKGEEKPGIEPTIGDEPWTKPEREGEPKTKPEREEEPWMEPRREEEPWTEPKREEPELGGFEGGW